MNRYVLLVPYLPNVIDATDAAEWSAHMASLEQGNACPVIVKLPIGGHSATPIEPRDWNSHAIVVPIGKGQA